MALTAARFSSGTASRVFGSTTALSSAAPAAGIAREDRVCRPRRFERDGREVGRGERVAGVERERAVLARDPRVECAHRVAVGGDETVRRGRGGGGRHEHAVAALGLEAEPVVDRAAGGARQQQDRLARAEGLDRRLGQALAEPLAAGLGGRPPRRRSRPSGRRPRTRRCRRSARRARRRAGDRPARPRRACARSARGCTSSNAALITRSAGCDVRGVREPDRIAAGSYSRPSPTSMIRQREPSPAWFAPPCCRGPLRPARG